MIGSPTGRRRSFLRGAAADPGVIRAALAAKLVKRLLALATKELR